MTSSHHLRKNSVDVSESDIAEVVEAKTMVEHTDDGLASATPPPDRH